MTLKNYATLRHPKMHPYTKFGILALKNIEDMHRTQSRTDGRTVGLAYGLYASLSSFAGIKTKCTCIPMKQNNSKKDMFIFSLHVYILSVYVIVVKFIHVVKFIGGGGDYVHVAKIQGRDYVHLYKNEKGGLSGGLLSYTLLSKQYQSTVDT